MGHMKCYLKAVKHLVKLVFANQSFQFEEVKEKAMLISTKELSKKDRQAIHRYAMMCLSVLDDAKSIRAKRWSVSDTGDAALEWLPLPVPNIDVCRSNDVIRYETVLFIRKKEMLISLKKAALSEKGVSVSGINLSSKELRLVHKVRSLTGRKVLERPILLDRRIHRETNIADAVWDVQRPDEACLAAAIESLPLPILFGIIQAGLATVMPLQLL